jgi:hypothetical protein
LYQSTLLTWRQRYVLKIAPCRADKTYNKGSVLEFILGIFLVSQIAKSSSAKVEDMVINQALSVQRGKELMVARLSHTKGSECATHLPLLINFKFTNVCYKFPLSNIALGLECELKSALACRELIMVSPAMILAVLQLR